MFELIQKAAETAGRASTTSAHWRSVLAYSLTGVFTVAVNFLIVAGMLFLVIKAINTLKRKEEAKPKPDVPADVKLLTEIRDLLATRK